MDPIRVNARFPHVPPNILVEFKRAAAQALDLTKREPGAFQCDWFCNDDQTVCVLHEAYTDSAALLAHIGNLRGRVRQGSREPRRLLVRGVRQPVPELREAVSGLDLTVFANFQGR
jgi:quinol monooxygenase YgiN